MAKLTYFPLLMDRWVAGTRELTFEQKGFYIDLLVYLYDSGKPIKDADHAARITGCDPRTSRRLLADLSQKFYRRSDGLRHKLVSEILKKGGRIKTLGTFENLTEQRSDPEPDPEKEKDCVTHSPKRKSTMPKFVRPKADEVQAYLDERGITTFTGQEFVDSNDAKGWVVGKNRTPMKDWRATVRTWQTNAKKHNGQRRKTFDEISRDLERMGFEDTGEILAGDGGDVRTSLVRRVWQ